MVMGIGMALLEGTQLDYRDGRVVNANMSDYLVPVNADVPALDADFLPGEDTVADPIGVKGLGERSSSRCPGHRQRGVQRDRQAHHRPAHHTGQAAVAPVMGFRRRTASDNYEDNRDAHGPHGPPSCHRRESGAFCHQTTAHPGARVLPRRSPASPLDARSRLLGRVSHLRPVAERGGH